MSETVSMERDGHILWIGLNRPAKRNAFDRAMLGELAEAYGVLENDPDIRCGVLYAHGDHFTAGLDLSDVAGDLATNSLTIPAGSRDPWRLDGPWTTPLVALAHGWVMTLGIELLLAADIRIAAANSRFTQYEVRRGIFPFGGATSRFPQQAGWGNAMRWMLTGAEFGADEALRIGLVQDLATDFAAGRDLAGSIAYEIANKAAPLGVRATLEAAYAATSQSLPDPGALRATIAALLATSDAAEGLRSFIERRDADFAGR
ncbi:enoyl-CoA hydratase [Rhodococcus sp. 06-462-5]|uniref:crotonase/enoyl-CoA hydratase family protein n=1 Tax=Nocardiaceae TaxID=85025 RepID=UPI0006914946|nr:MULTISPECIES: crotonase/enoyl-CoA hydratase family protein [Rhodococcus]OZC73941.1 enoyl-CoA hydratase [Rhodococcus sp. 06-462-5]OZE67937.1 enoyl-CoA hydratase [Rhodococcus sp. 02-925g]OZF51056.1 enoyl-CoA hydratase [Rhodococcus sp. 14-1411-2a]